MVEQISNQYFMTNSKFHSWRIGTINIRTGKEDHKLDRVINEIIKANLSICCLQEVRRLKNNSVTITNTNTNDNIVQKYELYWSGHTTKRYHGVGIAIKVDKYIEVEEIIPVNARTIIANLSVYGCSLKVICCYAPTEEDTDSSKNSFYNTLNKHFKCEKHQKVICLGDFNASSSAVWYNSSLRENTIINDLIVNNNGQRFHEFINQHRLSVLNTWFCHKRCRRITWHSPDGKTKKVYDFVLACSWIRQYVTNCRVYNSYDFDTDHRLVIADLRTPCTKLSRFIQRAMKPKRKYLDINALKRSETSEQFSNAVTAKLDNVDMNATNTEINDHLIRSINTSAEDTLPLKPRTRLYQPWHDDDILRTMYDQKDQLIAHNADTKQLSSIRKRIRNRAKYLKNEHFKAEAEKINQHAINRDLEKLFQRAKNQETLFKTSPGKISPDKILNHFQQHFNHNHSGATPEELTDKIPAFINDLRDISARFHIDHTKPTMDEIRTHLHRLKSGKSSNDIDPELLKKCESPIMLQVIQKMTENLWNEMDLPNTWGNSRLKTIWKGKGSKADPSKYRGLSIGSTVCKMIISIILERIRPWYEAQLSDEQNGFRKNRGTTDGIYSLKRVHQISNRKKQALYLLFVDLTAAFDHIPRRYLFDSIRLRFPDNENLKLFDILKLLYEKTSLTYDDALTTFLVTSGVRQGGPESPLLFNLFIDFVMRIFIDKCTQDHTIHFFDHKYRINPRSVSREERLNMRQNNNKLWGENLFPWCGYADDLILFVIDPESLQKATEILDEVFTEFGLKINESKTETMILNNTFLESEYPKSIISLRNVALKNSTDFKYLGSYVSHDEPNTGDAEINHRIQMAQAKFATLSNLLLNRNIIMKTRIKFLNSLVRSRLVYSCQNWNLNVNQYEKMDTVYRNFLRRMVRGGFKRTGDNEFRYKFSNDKIHSICGTSDVSTFIRLQQRNYAGHVVRMAMDRSTKQLMFNDDRYHRTGRLTPSLIDQVVRNENCTIDEFVNRSLKYLFEIST